MSDAQQPQEDERQRDARQRMVRRQLLRRGIVDERVLDAMLKVPRHEFVPEDARHLAYDDSPQHIGSGQTISQPYMVAAMTQALRLQPADRVLEIGVGSGYQTAVLAELVREVVGIERLPELAVVARRRLKRLGYTNVTIHIGDGTEGYAPAAPYDAIIVAAAAPAVPPPLIQQLADGGRLVIPVGSGYEQELRLVERSGNTVTSRSLMPVRFVPLIGRYGFENEGEA
ncbi:MAG: protein-L-isoaspartate(D-aspartate) O-methyltransferase [Aggregatilineales bacterium]